MFDQFWWLAIPELQGMLSDGDDNIYLPLQLSARLYGWAAAIACLFHMLIQDVKKLPLNRAEEENNSFFVSSAQSFFSSNGRIETW